MTFSIIFVNISICSTHLMTYKWKIVDILAVNHSLKESVLEEMSDN